MTADSSTGTPGGDVAPGRHRRPRRLWWGVVGGLAAAVVAGTTAVVVVAPWPDGAARLRAAGPVGSAESPTADPTSGVTSPGAPDRSRGVGPLERPHFPDASTTGVPDGATLTPSGSVVVQDTGAVIENLLIVDGIIDVQADDVVVRNVRITNDREFIQWGIIQQEGRSGLVVEDSEIFGNGGQKFASGISNHGGMLVVRRVEIHTITDGIVTSHGLIEDSYLHSPLLFAGDHTDMIQTVGGSLNGLRLDIRNNTVINTEPQTAALMLDDANGVGLVPVHDVLVEGNLLAGGGYTIYAGGMVAEGHDPADIVIRGNVFSRELWPNSGFYGPVAYFDVGAPGNVWSGNVWEDDGSPVALD